MGNLPFKSNLSLKQGHFEIDIYNYWHVSLQSYMVANEFKAVYLQEFRGAVGIQLLIPMNEILKSLLLLLIKMCL